MIATEREINELEILIKSTIIKTIHEERFNLQMALVPTVSEREMKGIIQQFGSPQNYTESDYEDISDWFIK
jgi:hypothetical protein